MTDKQQARILRRAMNRVVVLRRYLREAEMDLRAVLKAVEDAQRRANSEAA